MRTNFDNSLFNTEFEKKKLEMNASKQKDEEERLQKLNKEIHIKKISEMTIVEIMSEWKISLIGILNDILNLHIHPNILFRDNRLLFLGATIILCVYLFYCINWIFRFDIKNKKSLSNEIKLFIKKD